MTTTVLAYAATSPKDDLTPYSFERREPLGAHAPYDGHFDLRAQGVEVLRASRVTGELLHGVARPAMCIVAHGAKKVFLGQEVFDYDASRLLVYSVDVPISGQITWASAEDPFLCLKVELDPELQRPGCCPGLSSPPSSIHRNGLA